MTGAGTTGGTGEGTIRVLVVDDSAFMRRAISDMLAEAPDIEVVGKATDGVKGVEMARELDPDVITMDIEMPNMDGLTALRAVMRECPTHVIMISSLTTKGSDAAIKALSYGAADAFAKDHSMVSHKIGEIQDDLLKRVRALAAHPHPRRRSKAKPTQSAPATATSSRKGPSAAKITADQFDAICIGSSTGGPPVVEQVLVGIEAGAGIPVLVAQHMPDVFTKSMAQRLNDRCSIPVRHGSTGMILEPGTVMICQGGMNTHLKRSGGMVRTTVDKLPESTIYYPSVNVMMTEAAKVYGSRMLAIVLTGMGDDGAEGTKAVKAAGGTVITQSADSCVVYGMPRAVDRAGCSDYSLSPEEIAGVVSRVASGTPRRAAG